jgi:hypothetical protein
VLSQYSDPRTGTTTERLNNINLTEPPRSLFEIPPDYTIREGGVIGGIIGTPAKK